MIINEFLYPHRRYQGLADPERTFNEKLEDFAQQVSFTCNLETGGKLSPEDAFERLGHLWHDLRVSRDELIGRS
ncbi:MAG: hypothetical protein ACFCU8_01810 [Thermosynechococcaceae cyanobacterium]